MAAMRSGGRPAVSTTLWVPSCDSCASIYSANSRLASLAALSSTLYWTEQCNNEITCFIFNFCLFSDLIVFLFFPLYLPSVSSRREWQLALGKPVRWWARRPTLPLLSDLAEHPKALHRFVKAPCGQRRQVSSVWLFVTEPLRVMHVLIIWVNQPAPPHSNKKEKSVISLIIFAKHFIPCCWHEEQ